MFEFNRIETILVLGRNCMQEKSNFFQRPWHLQKNVKTKAQGYALKKEHAVSLNQKIIQKESAAQCAQCGNCGNLLSHYFVKNFVKATCLLTLTPKKFVNSWFDEIIFVVWKIEKY